MKGKKPTAIAEQLPAVGRRDWEASYRDGTPPWDIGRPADELVRVLDESLIAPGRVLELGCGTGADAICLAQRGFEVTAVDSAPTAIERARIRAEPFGVAVRFVLADAFKFGPTAGQFDLVYEAGFYHFVRQSDLERFLDLLWRITRPGSLYLSLSGSDGETAEGGPPKVSPDEVRRELGRLFEIVSVRPCRIESPHRAEGYLGWSCLLRRPQISSHR